MPDEPPNIIQPASAMRSALAAPEAASSLGFFHGESLSLPRGVMRLVALTAGGWRDVSESAPTMAVGPVAGEELRFAGLVAAAAAAGGRSTPRLGVAEPLEMLLAEPDRGPTADDLLALLIEPMLLRNASSCGSLKTSSSSSLPVG